MIIICKQLWFQVTLLNKIYSHSFKYSSLMQITFELIYLYQTWEGKYYNYGSEKTRK